MTVEILQYQQELAEWKAYNKERVSPPTFMKSHAHQLIFTVEENSSGTIKKELYS